MGASVLQGGTLSDLNMAWKRKRIYLTPAMMSAVKDDGTSGLSESAIEGVAVIHAEVAALGIAGYTMGADGEQMQGGIPFPYDMDPAYEIGFKVVFSVDVSGSDSVLWTIQYKRIGEGVIYSAPSQVLDTIIADKAVASDSLHSVTTRGIALAATHVFTQAMIDADDWLMIEVTMTTGTGSPTDIIFLGVIMDYAVKRCSSTGTDVDQPLGG